MNHEVSPVPESLQELLTRAAEAGASDLHLIAGYPPVLRLHGDLIELPEPSARRRTRPRPLLRRAVPAGGVRPSSTAEKNVDFSFDLALDRISRTASAPTCSTPAGRSAAACGWCRAPSRTSSGPASRAELAERLAFVRDGLVIVTGATGSGKTTTLAMIVNLLNQRGGYRIITVEEPVEYLFPRRANSVVTQREVGGDVLTFADGLKYGLRQDPDVILVGEIRDRETAQMALSAAETGHLVFTTLHTRDAKGAITRYADLFPQDVQRDVRSQLALSLRAVVSQRLLPGAETRGEAAPGPGGVVEHLPDRQRHPQRQDREHRQLPADRPRRGHGELRRIGPATAAGGARSRRRWPSRTSASRRC